MDMVELLGFIDDLCESDPKGLSDKYMKSCEEHGELATALLPYQNSAGTLHRFVTRENVLEEIADTMLCLYSIAHKINADYTEILRMVEKKAVKWQALQVNEGSLKDIKNVPYELHVSVDNEDQDQEWFENPSHAAFFDAVCAHIGVKSARLLLYMADGSTKHDWMTSSTVFGDNQFASINLLNIKAKLENEFKAAGVPLKVGRLKIETVPWHPASPTEDGPIVQMPEDCYFEKHWEVMIPDARLDSIWNNFHSLQNGAVVLSRNLRKPDEVDGATRYSFTLRDYTGSRFDFESQCREFEFQLKTASLTVLDSIAEFAIYDTDVSKDDGWIRKQLNW